MSAQAPVIDPREWLLSPESRQLDPSALIEGFAARLTAAAVPIWRLNTSLLTLHPEVFVRNVRWGRETGAETVARPHSITTSSAFVGSPIEAVYRDGAQIRCRLEQQSDPPYPQLVELKSLGGTDYFILPLPFGDGRRSYISFATDAAGGFSDAHIRLFEGLVPALSLRFELESTRFAMESLLLVYLGRNAAARVLAGSVRRGQGKEIEAAIWFCDLRGFTSLGDRASGSEVVSVLDRYFECVATPIEENGGEILKFIGDAVLAIFPVGEEGPLQPCRSALTAAQAALAALEKLSAEIAHPLRMGVALHVGNVMYGNIGARGRLDFTVIGASVNEVSRVESMCKELKQNLLMTRPFVQAGEIIGARSLGEHTLRGVSRPQELFTIG